MGDARTYVTGNLVTTTDTTQTSYTIVPAYLLRLRTREPKSNARQRFVRGARRS